MRVERRRARFYEQQVLDRLNPRMIEFIGRMEMVFIATGDRRGEGDCAFRAGPPGFVRVLDERRLAWLDRPADRPADHPGNGGLAGAGDFTGNGKVGLLFVDFFRDVIGLHVTGTAGVISDEALRFEYPDLPVDPVAGRCPARWVCVRVEEAYLVRRKSGDLFGAAARRVRETRAVLL
jgi:predicted pyridoxine 5'-phosphate oxidase superfamily flavin-nucleotide-binding protein